jgi:hypothetical protein
VVGTVQEGVVEADVVGATHDARRGEVDGAGLARVVEVGAGERARAAAPVPLATVAAIRGARPRGAGGVSSARHDCQAARAVVARRALVARGRGVEGEIARVAHALIQCHGARRGGGEGPALVDLIAATAEARRGTDRSLLDDHHDGSLEHLDGREVADLDLLVDLLHGRGLHGGDVRRAVQQDFEFDHDA